LVEEDQFAGFDEDLTCCRPENSPDEKTLDSTLPSLNSAMDKREDVDVASSNVCSESVTASNALPTSTGRFSVTRASDDALSHGGIVQLTDGTLSDC